MITEVTTTQLRGVGLFVNGAEVMMLIVFLAERLWLFGFVCPASGFGVGVVWSFFVFSKVFSLYTATLESCLCISSAFEFFVRLAQA
jgi:uncharacterized membrane protein